MDIHEMHELFRTLGQQMGIQQVRGILPESIDTFINSAIIDKVNAILSENTLMNFQNKVVIQRNEASVINALRTLYTELNITPSNDNIINLTNFESSAYVYLGFSINYSEDTDKYYKCRIVEETSLEDTLNDYCNKDSKIHPIINLYNDSRGSFVGKIYNNKTKIASAKVKYLSNPIKVNEGSYDNTHIAINCNLPEHLHNEIVQIAVSKFFKSVGYTTPTSNNANK